MDRVSVQMPRAHRSMDIEDLLEHQQVAREVFAERSTIAYAVVVEPTLDRGQVRTALRDLRPDGATATGDALDAAVDRLEARRGKDGRRAPAAVILLSDGKRTEGGDPIAAAQRARQLGIPVSTVALGTEGGTVLSPIGEPVPVPPDPATLQEISRITGGTFTQAADAGGLDDVYEQLGSKVGTRRAEREITSGFAAAG